MKKQSCDLLQVYDDGGSERSGEEAIEVWRSQLAKFWVVMMKETGRPVVRR